MRPSGRRGETGLTEATSKDCAYATPHPSMRAIDRIVLSSPLVRPKFLKELSAFRDDQRNVVLLLAGGEMLDVGDGRCDHRGGRLIAIFSQGFDQPRFAEILAGCIERFGDAVGVQSDHIA